VKCAAYFAPPGQEALIDYEDVALREGVILHRRIKEELGKLRVNLPPLLLVQVSSKDRSVEQAREKLLDLGFTEAQIAVHTPDSGLLALANDESREVLIFKMSVALGFDAPRAAILVSMRAARDEDFGVQLVGRILRFHRRLQGRARAKSLPEILKFGYVFLADATAQDGLDRAGQRINRLRTEYAKVSPTTAVVRIGEQVYVQVVGEDGQMSLLPVDAPIYTPLPYNDSIANQTPAEPSGEPEDLVLELMTGQYAVPSWFQRDTPLPQRIEATAVFRTAAGYSYKIRTDVHDDSKPSGLFR
jgi:type III restriction enzyme